ncbi:hypothetical protein [Dictyobacter arantiisoli]|nr:hypothetical protein [Dictyobacter arantiisoli]
MKTEQKISYFPCKGKRVEISITLSHTHENKFNITICYIEFVDMYVHTTPCKVNMYKNHSIHSNGQKSTYKAACRASLALEYFSFHLIPSIPTDTHNPCKGEVRVVIMLHIQHLELIAEIECLLRFTGSSEDFYWMGDCLRGEGYQYAHWDPEALTGRGAWQLDLSVLQMYSEHFDNYAFCMQRATNKF